jgi:hypothetical protein
VTEPLTMSNAILRHKLRCKYSNLVIGTLEVQTTAGAIPYLSYWNECIQYHSVFSLPPKRLFDFARDEWKRLATKDIEGEISQAESEILCVTYLAMLHTLDCIKQDFPCLPPLAVVQSTISKLLHLAYWKWKLESERFKFPTLHISKYNHNSNFENINDYLELCFSIRTEYEKNVREVSERAKLKAIEDAMIALNDTWITPTSKRVLWQWVRTHLPSEYASDAQGWLSTLFLGGSAAIIDFDKEDIDLAEEIITASCPIGTGVMHAVRQRLKSIRGVWEQHHESFSIELDEFAEDRNLYVNGEKVIAPHPGPQPVLSAFKSKAGWIIANAKWEIAKAAYLKDGGIL